MSKPLNIEDIAGMLADRAEAVCRWLLPKGVKVGDEWCVGNVYGDEGDSLRVNISENHKKGIWKDFASDEKGGDLVDLIEAVKKVNTFTALKLAKDFLGIKDVNRLAKFKQDEYQKPDISRLREPSKELLAWFAKERGFSEVTVSTCKIKECAGKDGLVAAFLYFNEKGAVDFVKYRPINNKGGMWTSPKARPTLFGWNNIQSKDYVVICEGELDAMAYTQAGIQALSVPFGAGTGGKQDKWIDNDWDKLAIFRKIYLSMDNDNVGQDAQRYIADRLGIYRCFNVSMPYKDANEAIQNGFNLHKALEKATYYTPNDFCSSREFIEASFDLIENGNLMKGETLPWEKSKDKARFRPGETTVWAGVNGHGKSMVLGNIIVDSVSHDKRWLVASMEYQPKRLLLRLYRQFLGKNGVSRADKDSLDQLFDNLWFYNVQGIADPKEMLDVFEYAFRRHGITHFLIDSLAKCGFNEDGYNEQKAFVDRLSSFARDNSVFVHLVCHVRKSDKETTMPDKFDIKGTGAIADMVDNVYIVWRNKPKEEAMYNIKSGDIHKLPRKEQELMNKLSQMPDCMILCCKQREGDWEGKFGLYFDKASLQYLDEEDSIPVNYSEKTPQETYYQDM